MHIADADSAEHGSASQNLIITAVSCALPNRPPGAPKLSGAASVRILPNTRLAAICGAALVEQFFCNYEVKAAFRPRMEAAGLVVSAVGPQQEVRAVELPQQRFFIATLFQPQLTSEADERPHPFILAFLRAAAARVDASDLARVAGVGGKLSRA
jgi:CTP synthase (UTP-ammonia lyase)